MDENPFGPVHENVPVPVAAKLIVEPVFTGPLLLDVTIGDIKVEDIPVTVPATQLEVKPDKAKPDKVPVLLFPLKSVKVVMLKLLALTKPWFSL
jgi:hypothetical protein